MSSGIIWGILLVLLGLSIISKTLFGFAIPFIRITIALMIIYFGITMLLSAMGYRAPLCCPFKGYKTKITGIQKAHQEFSTVFSEGTIDASDLVLTEATTFLGINTVFGNTTLLLNPEVSTKIIINNVFAKTTFPDETEFSAIGEQTFFYGPAQSEPQLVIKANVVFGNLVIKKK